MRGWGSEPTREGEGRCERSHSSSRDSESHARALFTCRTAWGSITYSRPTKEDDEISVILGEAVKWYSCSWAKTKERQSYFCNEVLSHSHMVFLQPWFEMRVRARARACLRLCPTCWFCLSMCLAFSWPVASMGSVWRDWIFFLLLKNTPLIYSAYAPGIKNLGKRTLYAHTNTHNAPICTLAQMHRYTCASCHTG